MIVKNSFIKVLLFFLVFSFISYKFIQITDNTLTAIGDKDQFGLTYKIPNSFVYKQITINIYSYNKEWTLERSIILNKKDITHNQLNINFVDENGKVNLYYEKNISNVPWYTLDSDKKSSANIYTLVDRRINYEETPLTMCITFDSNELGQEKYKGYINKWNEVKRDFDKYQLNYPLILEDPAQSTIVTYQFVK